MLEFLEWCEDLQMEPVLRLRRVFMRGQRVEPGTNLVSYVNEHWRKSSMLRAIPGPNGARNAQRMATRNHSS